MSFHVTCVVIGAGAVGLSIARALAGAGHDCLLIEKQAQIGQGVSSRNSEVIHAGIYYPSKSKKAQLCVEGKQLLYAFCEQFAVSHQACGKFIVASDANEADKLTEIYQQGLENGVNDLVPCSRAEINRKEPAVNAVAALYSPSTGIVSAHDYMQALLGDFEAKGGVLSTHAEVVGIRAVSEGYEVVVSIEGEPDPFVIGATAVVNAAGLGAQTVARTIQGISLSSIPELYFCRGNYFSLRGKNPFRHLIYPVPPSSGAGLGIHATIDLGGQVKFGPDVEYIDEEIYHVNLKRRRLYFEAIRRYFPDLKEDDLIPSYSGIRPKIQGPLDAPADFVIREESAQALPNLVNLFGIESPGLTASLAIANEVNDLLTI